MLYLQSYEEIKSVKHVCEFRAQKDIYIKMLVTSVFLVHVCTV